MFTIEELHAIANETVDGAGSIRVGVAACDPFDEVQQAFASRIEQGHDGGLGFTYSEPETATNPAISFPWATSIVVVAVPYLVEGDGTGDEGDRTIARFADGDRYERVRAVLDRLDASLTLKGFRTEKVYDDDRLVDRAVAVRAGVAWAGKSTMALTPGHGPWFLIGSVVTDAHLDRTPAMTRSCGTCTACIPACPTGAIVAPGVLDANRCLAAVLQRPGPIPRELRKAVGSRVYGCDDCLVACPPGDQAIEPLSTIPTITPVDVLALSDEELDQLASHWYVPKRNMRHVRRNALVALGNTSDPTHVGVLAGHLGHPDPLLRIHAAWALGEVGSPHAVAALTAAEAEEEDVTVRTEIALAVAISDGRHAYAEDPDET